MHWTRARLLSGLFASVIAIGSVAAADGRERCEFYKMFACSAVRCWDNTAVPAWSILDWDQHTYSICDNSGCKTFPFVSWPDGIYVTMDLPGRDLMVKYNGVDQSIVETATLLNDSITSFGNCVRDDGH